MFFVSLLSGCVSLEADYLTIGWFLTLSYPVRHARVYGRIDNTCMHCKWVIFRGCGCECECECECWVEWDHYDVIKWKHFSRYWPFVQGIHRSPVNSPHKGQWRRALVFSLICVWINGWVNNREAGYLRRYRAHYDDTVMGLIECGGESVADEDLPMIHWIHIWVALMCQ